MTGLVANLARGNSLNVGNDRLRVAELRQVGIEAGTS
jgi:hypothetical protein